MSLFNNAIIGASGQQGYQISRSVRLRRSASAYLNRTLGSGNRQTWTWSKWIKRANLTDDQFAFQTYGAGGFGIQGRILFNPNSLDFIFDYNGGSQWRLTTTQVFRDPSAWYHIVVVADTTNATSGDRLRMYVNGIRVTSFSSANYPTQNANGTFNQAYAHAIGADTGAAGCLDGYLTEINFIDGQALTPSSFGETNAITGVWQPKKYAGTYGTNGFYLNFSDNSGATATTIGKDYSGNGNNWTPNNISVTAGTTYDSMLDVPTPYADGGNGRGNYAVVNPLNTHSVITVSGANLNTTYAGGAYQAYGTGTVGITTGKFYWEITVNTIGATGVGIFQAAGRVLGTEGTNNTFNSASSYIYFLDGKKYNGSDVGVAYGATYTTGDIIGVAFDADNGTLTFYKNNSSQGTAYTGLTATPYLPSFTCYSGSNLSFNFGQRPFTYTPPTGFVALNTQNLPTPTISNGAAYMAATTYTGTGATQTISNAVNGVSFQPDLVWIKRRNAAYDHDLFDAVRGAGLSLYSSTTAAEGSGEGQDSFNTNGFTVSGNHNRVNISGGTFAAWQWNAGGSTVTNTSGSISAQVRANPTAGFSVVTYTGNGSSNQTVGHGLGVTPSMVICKRRDSTSDWPVAHRSYAADGYTLLNSTIAATTTGLPWGTGTRTSTTFMVNTGSINMNASTATYVAYCFAPVAGYSAFGSYTGNGSTDGPMVFCGFQPRFVMFKKTSATSNWSILDTSRDAYNVADNPLLPNTSGAETTSTSGSGAFADILSNGFKLRGNSGDINDSGATYIFAAFASVPFKNSLAF